MHQSGRGIDAQIALSDLADLLNAASVPEHLKRQPNLAFLTQEQLAERWGLSIDTLRGLSIPWWRPSFLRWPYSREGGQIPDRCDPRL